jgi:hypothetical protein
MKQLSLGELTKKVNAHLVLRETDEKEGKVYYDFGFYSFYPTSINSWRGDYSHLALDITIFEGMPDNDSALTISKFHQLLIDANGKDFEGYKGGIYTSWDDTPLWVANWGDSGYTAVSGVKRHYDSLIIQTMYEDY